MTVLREIGGEPPQGPWDAVRSALRAERRLLSAAVSVRIRQDEMRGHGEAPDFPSMAEIVRWRRWRPAAERARLPALEPWADALAAAFAPLTFRALRADIDMAHAAMPPPGATGADLGSPVGPTVEALSDRGEEGGVLGDVASHVGGVLREDGRVEMRFSLPGSCVPVQFPFPGAEGWFRARRRGWLSGVRSLDLVLPPLPSAHGRLPLMTRMAG